MVCCFFEHCQGAEKCVLFYKKMLYATVRHQMSEKSSTVDPTVKFEMVNSCVLSSTIGWTGDLRTMVGGCIPSSGNQQIVLSPHPLDSQD